MAGLKDLQSRHVEIGDVDGLGLALRAENSQQLIQTAQANGSLALEGRALADVPIDFCDREVYLARLSKSRRKNLHRKLKSLQQLHAENVATGDACFQDECFREKLYQLYLQVYQ